MSSSLIVLCNSCILALTIIFISGVGTDEGLQDKCVANEEVIRWFRKRQEIENKERDRYKEAVCTLDIELIAKLTLLEEKTCHHEEAKKAKTNVTTELAALHKEMDKAKVDVVVAFRVSQPFFNEWASFMVTGLTIA